jgi:cytochrome c biogenesis protein CcmG, thiol:disulfide interchange protein DsbE
MRALLRLVAAVLAAVVVTSCGATMPPSYAKSPLSPAGAAGEETKPLPEIRRRTIDGATFSSHDATAQGKVVVVKFFAEYCEPCKKSLPWFQAFAREHRDVAVVGIAEDERESQVRELAEAYGLTFPVVHDLGNALAGRFRVSDMPMTFVADRHGRVRWVGGPGQTEADLEAAVRASSHEK